MKMWRLLAIFIITTLYLQSIEACSCIIAHPQFVYCNADFIIKATARNNTIDPNRTLIENRVFTIDTITAYKSNAQVQQALLQKKLYTAEQSATCGANLPLNKPLVISGSVTNNNELHISLCGFIRLRSEVPDKIIIGLKGAYKCGCKCQITACFDGTCPKTERSCEWDRLTKVQENQYMCYPKNKTECAWKILNKKIKC